MMAKTNDKATAGRAPAPVKRARSKGDAGVVPIAAKPLAGVVDPLGALRREVDRLIEDFTSNFPRWPLGRAFFDDRLWRLPALPVGVPVVDVAETGTEYRITAELPGMDEKDVEVSLSGDALTIRGEKKESKDQSHRGYRLSERRYGMFERTFALPTGVDASGIAAQFSKGVLHVTLPKTPQAKKEPKKIAVKSA